MAKGSVSRVDASFVHLCSPLGVVAQPNKLRLILDLRFRLVPKSKTSPLSILLRRFGVEI